MRAHQHVAPLVVVRSEAESGRVGLRLIGELDLNTVAMLETELAGSRDQGPPAVIDLSELRFLDLIGLRALLRAGQAEGARNTRMVGATGIVRRLINLTRALDAETAAAAGAAPPHKHTIRVKAQSLAEDEVVANGKAAANGNGKAAANRNGNGNRASNGNGNGAGRGAAPARNRKTS